MFEKLEETFDLIPMKQIVPTELTTIETKESITPIVVDSDEARDKEDQELARKTFRKMIQRSENMLDSLVVIADGTEHPRAFEVAANLVKTIADVAAKLDEVSSRKSKQKETSEEKATNINHNHLYVGSSEDLMKMIRSGKD